MKKTNFTGAWAKPILFKILTTLRTANYDITYISNIIVMKPKTTVRYLNYLNRTNKIHIALWRNDKPVYKFGPGDNAINPNKKPRRATITTKKREQTLNHIGLRDYMVSWLFGK